MYTFFKITGAFQLGDSIRETPIGIRIITGDRFSFNASRFLVLVLNGFHCTLEIPQVVFNLIFQAVQNVLRR